jgi:hypothetical protein
MNAQSGVASRQASDDTAWWLTPLRIRGTALPPNLLLAARLITLCFIGTGQILHLSSHFLPFIPFFERLASPAAFHWTLTAAFLFGTGLLFFTRFSRSACLLLSSVLFISLLSSRMYFENNRMFCACILLLIGLSSARQQPWLVRLQVAMVYFGAALNKLLDADWRSGQFFAFWFGKVHNPELWTKITHFVPGMPLAQFMDWTVISLEFVLAIGFLVPRFYSWAIWLGVCYHTALMVAMNTTFGMFYYAMLISYLAFVEWPEPGIVVAYDGDSGFFDTIRQWLRRFDPERNFEWRPLGADRLGASAEAFANRLSVTFGGKELSGLSAFKVLLLYSPFVYFVYAGIACLQPRVPGYHWLAILVIVFFLPIGHVAKMASNWMSRDRPVISSATCPVEAVAKSSSV